jgi:hypothetical protein
MAVNTFNSHLDEVGARLQDLRNTIDELEGLLKRHNHNAYDTLVAGDYAGRAVTKLQYDNALSSIDNLLNTWLTAGNGTNIDNYLFEIP